MTISVSVSGSVDGNSMPHGGKAVSGDTFISGRHGSSVTHKSPIATKCLQSLTFVGAPGSGTA
jgi:hypothetical protein